MVEKINQFVEWYESTALYMDLFSKLPEPFDNVYLEALIFFGFVIFIIVVIKEKIADYRFRKRIKAKQRKLQEQHVDGLLDTFKKEDQAISQILEKKTEQMKVALSEEIKNTILEGLQREPSIDNGEVFTPSSPSVPIEECADEHENEMQEQTIEIPLESEDARQTDTEKVVVEEVFVQEEQKPEPRPQRVSSRETATLSPDQLKAFIVPQRIDEPQEEESEPEETKPIVNIAEIIATKATSQEETSSDAVTTSDEFNSIIAEIQKKNAAKEKSRQITEEVQEVRKQNIEVLNRKIKQALTSETPVQKQAEDDRSEKFSKELERRKKEALKIAERERAKQEKAQKKNSKKK